MLLSKMCFKAGREKFFCHFAHRNCIDTNFFNICRCGIGSFNI